MRGLDTFKGAGQVEQSAANALSPAQYQPPSVLDQLHQRKQILTGQLATVNEAIAALEANPETVKIMDLLGKVGHF